MSDLIDALGNGATNIVDNLTNITDTYISLEKIIPGVTDLLFDQNSEIRKLSKELGSANKTVSSFRDEILNVSKATGTAVKQTIELLNVTRQYHQGVKDTTAATARFAKITGVSTDIIGKFSAKLNILGNISEKTMESMYTGILSVRDAYGLTDDQIGDIITTLTKYATVTQMSNEEIAESAVVLSKFTSQLTSAGIEADKVSEIINSMVDPDKLTDNLMLMSKMGITINDMVSGDPVSMLEDSIDNLKSLGEEVAEIAKTNRFQASELAKIYGFTLEQAVELSKIDNTAKALDKQKTLQEYQKQAATLADNIAYFKNTVGAFITGGINMLIKPIEKLTDTINQFGKGSLALLTFLVGKVLLNKLKKGLDNLFGQAARKFSKSVSDAMSSYIPAVGERAGRKAADVAGLTPKSEAAAQTGKLGYGYGYMAKAEERRRKLVDSVTLKTRLRDVKLDEYLSASNSYDDFAKEIQKRYNNSNSDKEKKILERRYGYFLNGGGYQKNKNSIIEKLSGLSYGNGLTGNDLLGFNIEGQTSVNSISNLIGDFKLGKAKEGADTYTLSNNLLTNVFGKVLSKEDAGAIMGKLQLNSKLQEQAAEIVSSSNSYYEALQKINQLFKDENFQDGIKVVSKNLDDINKAVKQRSDLTELTNETVRVGNKAQTGKLGFGARIQSFGGFLGNAFKGTMMNIGTFLMKTLNPLRLLKVGGLSLLGMAIPKVLEKLKGNEEFQEKISGVTEKFGELFSTVAEKIMPVVEPLTELISNVITWVAPIVAKLSEWIAGAANFLIKIIGKPVASLASSVKTIEDSYKEEDLRTMTLVQGAKYDANTDQIYAIIDKVSTKLDKIVDNQETTANTLVAGQMAGS